MKEYLTPRVDMTYSFEDVILTSDEHVVDVDDVFSNGGIE